MGGFLLHPYAATLRDHYTEQELVMYSSREELFEKIDHYTKYKEQRQEIAEAGYARTWAEHTYVHRCARLIELVKERVL